MNIYCNFDLAIVLFQHFAHVRSTKRTASRRFWKIDFGKNNAIYVAGNSQKAHWHLQDCVPERATMSILKRTYCQFFLFEIQT